MTAWSEKYTCPYRRAATQTGVSDNDFEDDDDDDVEDDDNNNDDDDDDHDVRVVHSIRLIGYNEMITPLWPVHYYIILYYNIV